VKPLPKKLAERDPWSAPLKAFLATQEHWVVADQLLGVVGVAPKQRDPLAMRRMAEALRKLGWERQKIRNGAKQFRAWVRTKNAAPFLSDPLRQFVQEAVVFDPAAETSFSDLFMRYGAWAGLNNCRKFSRAAFGKKVRPHVAQATWRRFGKDCLLAGIRLQSFEPCPVPPREQWPAIIAKHVAFRNVITVDEVLQDFLGVPRASSDDAEKVAEALRQIGWAHEVRVRGKGKKTRVDAFVCPSVSQKALEGLGRGDHV
jgi:hypothetical protein